MRSAIGWVRSICLLAMIGLAAAVPPASAAPAAATPAAAAAEPAAEAAPPQHGGGGFALLLLDYRQGLERLTMALRAAGAELAEGATMAPAEMTAALHRVTAGTAFRMTAPRQAGTASATGSPTPALGRWSTCSGSVPSRSPRSRSRRSSPPPPARRAASS